MNRMVDEFYDFEIPGEPVAKARPRMSSRNGVNRVYTPSKSVNFEQLVGFAFASKYKNHIPTKKPVKIKIMCFYSFPNRLTKKKEDTIKWFMVDNDMPYPRAKKPDVDNLIKSVLDGLNSIAFEDDKQVFEITAGKYYGHRPRTVVEIRSYDTEVI